MMSELDVGDFTREEDKRETGIGNRRPRFGTKIRDGSLDFVTLMNKLSFDGSSSSSDRKS